MLARLGQVDYPECGKIMNVRGTFQAYGQPRSYLPPPMYASNSATNSVRLCPSRPLRAGQPAHGRPLAGSDLDYCGGTTGKLSGRDPDLSKIIVNGEYKSN